MSAADDQSFPSPPHANQRGPLHRLAQTCVAQLATAQTDFGWISASCPLSAVHSGVHPIHSTLRGAAAHGKHRVGGDTKLIIGSAAKLVLPIDVAV
jgi:hypothetical protein